MASAHHGRARGGARARGGRARAHHAALGAGRGHLQGCATLSNMHMVTWLWLAKSCSSISKQAFPWRERTMVVLMVVLVLMVVVLVLVLVVLRKAPAVVICRVSTALSNLHVVWVWLARALFKAWNSWCLEIMPAKKVQHGESTPCSCSWWCSCSWCSCSCSCSSCCARRRPWSSAGSRNPQQQAWDVISCL